MDQFEQFRSGDLTVHPVPEDQKFAPEPYLDNQTGTPGAPPAETAPAETAPATEVLTITVPAGVTIKEEGADVSHS